MKINPFGLLALIPLFLVIPPEGFPYAIATLCVVLLSFFKPPSEFKTLSKKEKCRYVFFCAVTAMSVLRVAILGT